MAAGLLAGALLGALDLFTMVRMSNRAAELSPARASTLVRWVAAGRVVFVFMMLALGAMALDQPAFLCLAASYVGVRVSGLLVVAGKHPCTRAERRRDVPPSDSPAGDAGTI
ncbi:MAG: hypothetical protein NUW12_06725 [Firmicutes bacterium]|nr:hypothetical protein [Bacillota bacterium]MDH7495842.1 hypothetical protein [Bacillota bacterium]